MFFEAVNCESSCNWRFAKPRPRSGVGVKSFAMCSGHGLSQTGMTRSAAALSPQGDNEWNRCSEGRADYFDITRCLRKACRIIAPLIEKLPTAPSAMI